MNNNRKTIKSILSYVFSFFLVISILLSFLLNLISTTILSEDYITSKLHEINYYTNVNKTINSEFEGYIEQSGFNKSILENVFTEKEVTADVNSIIRSMYQNTSYTINTKTIEDNLNKNINNYIVGNNLTLDIKQKENVNTFVSTLSGTYSKNIFPKEIISPISNMIDSLNTIVSRLGSFINLLPVICMLCIILINLSRVLTSFKYISFSFLSAGMFLTVAYVLLNNSVQVGKISIFTKSISDIVNLLFKNIFSELNNYCVTFAILGLVLTFAFIVLEDKFKFEILSSKGVNSHKWSGRY